MFTDVYKELPRNLEKQLAEMKEHLSKYKDHYPVDTFEKI